LRLIFGYANYKMKKGVSYLGCIPMRQNPETRSEMTSQLLFGETFSILDEIQACFHVTLDHDDSRGWIDKESVRVLESSSEVLSEPRSSFRMVTFTSLAVLDLEAGNQLILPAGSIWPSGTASRINLHGRHFELISQEGLDTPGKEVNLAEPGKRLLSLPSIHGGRCGFGFDAPGLVQMLCLFKGIQVPRTSQSQAELGNSINFMHEIAEGDLAFFNNADGEIDHVGILLEKGRILHAYQQVRIDRFDQQGIYCSERDKYTHKLRIIKRIGE
jgi:hypothetical protein